MNVKNCGVLANNEDTIYMENTYLVNRNNFGQN